MSATSESRNFEKFDDLAGEFAARFRRGERPSLQEFMDRAPELADEIRELFPALVEVEQVEEARDTAPRPAPTYATAPPLREVGDYRVVREVGRGGMGVVYEAEQVSLGRRVALKMLPRNIAHDGKMLARFRREARAAARLHHTNIVPVFEVGQDGDVVFYAMQFIQGQGLDRVIDELRGLRQGIQSGGDAATPARVPDTVTAAASGPAVSQVARSLLYGRFDPTLDESPGQTATACHEETGGTVAAPALAETEGGGGAGTGSVAATPHRQEPPHPEGGQAPAAGSAVLPGATPISAVESGTGRRDRYIQGVARIGQQAAGALAFAHSRGIVHRDIKPSNLLLDTEGVVWITDFGLAKTDDEGLSETGDILGTLRYMAPERFRGEGDARADVYGLGLTLYELLTLQPAYDSRDRLELIERIKNAKPVRPRALNARIPRDLETVVLKAIEKDPKLRYPSADELAEDLRRFLDDEPIAARRSTAVERYVRWARRNPVIAVLGGVLTAVLVLATIGSLITANRFARSARLQEHLARLQEQAALAERAARHEAEADRKAAELARAAALAETYRATLGETRALRVAHSPGWRNAALGNLARLATMPTPRRDLVALRSEAIASLGDFDVELVARFDGHKTAVSSVAFSPDGKTLASISADGILALWSVEGRRALRTVPNTGRAVKGSWCRARFLPDGSGLVISNRTPRVSFLTADGSGEARPAMTVEGNVTAVDLDAAGRRMVVAGTARYTDLIEVATGATTRRIPDSELYAAISPDGRWVATVGPNHSVMLTDLMARSEPVAVGRHRDIVLDLRFDPDGVQLATASNDGTVKIWDVAAQAEAMTLRGHKSMVSGVVFSPDGRLVASCSHDLTVRLWDAHTGEPLMVLPTNLGNLMDIAFSPDGTHLAVGGQLGSTALYQLTARRESTRLFGHTYHVQGGLAFHPTEPWLFSTAVDQYTCVWNWRTGRLLRRWKDHPDGFMWSLALSPDGTLLATGPGALTGREHNDYAIRLRRAGNGDLVGLLPAHESAVVHLVFDESGRYLASKAQAGGAIVWDVATGKVVWRQGVGGGNSQLAFLPDNQHLLICGDRGQLLLVDPIRGVIARTTEVPGARKLVIMPDGKSALVGSQDGALRRVSLPDLVVTQLARNAPESRILTLAASPDGTLLASTLGDGRLQLHDARTLRLLSDLPPLVGSATVLAFDPSGTHLAIAGIESDVVIWDLGLVRAELAGVGLAWDQPQPAVPAPVSVAGDDRPHSVDVAAIQLESSAPPVAHADANALEQSGRQALDQRQFGRAAGDLRKAIDAFRRLAMERGDRHVLAHLFACFRHLAAAERAAGHAADASAAATEALMVLGKLEGLHFSTAGDLYDAARGYCQIAGLIGPGTDGTDPAECDRLQVRAVTVLRRALESRHGDLERMDHDPELDSLRGRTDYQELVLDRSFPRDPFADPASLRLRFPLPADLSAQLAVLSASIAHRPADAATWSARGQFLARRGEWVPALADYRRALELNPADVILWTSTAVLYLQAGDSTGYRRHARAMLDRFATMTDPFTAQRTARMGLLIPPPPEDLARLKTIADGASELEGNDPNLPWFQLARGMAAYRAGRYEAATLWLRQALNSSLNFGARTTIRIYLAMAEQRAGHTRQARAVFDEAGHALGSVQAEDDWDAPWRDWLIADLTFREAELLIEDAKP